MPLTPKQARFVAEYQVDLNATQAAIRAGYSPTSAHVTASRMLSDAKVRAAVEQTQRKVTEAVLDSAEDVIRDAVKTYNAAMAAEQYGAAVSALTLRAKRHAEFSDKVDARVLHGMVRVERGTRSLS